MATAKKQSAKEVAKDKELEVKRTKSKEIKRKETKKTATGKKETKVEKKTVVKRAPKGKVLSAMDRLMETEGGEVRAFKRGEEIEGKVQFVSRSLVLLDVGAKTEGVVTDKDVKEAADLLSELKVGDKIKAYVKYPENDQGHVVLSLRKALEKSRWEGFEKWLDEDREIEVKGLEVNKGGMIVTLDSIHGFVPTSQFGEQYLGKMSQLLGKTFKVKVIEVDREQNRLIFSEKLVSDASGLARKTEALEKVEVGQMFVGTVSGIMPFGVFVTVTVPVKDEKDKQVGEAKVEGLVHISEISWEKVSDPNELFKVGDEVDVSVIGIDKKSNKLNLSIKRLADDPWKGVEKKYAVGTKHEGKVVRIAPYGVLVNFERGIDGLIHVSKQPSGKEFKLEEKVNVYVETLDAKHRRMSLGVVLTEVPVGYR